MLLIVVEHAKLKKVNLVLLIVINLVEDESVVGQSEVDSHFAHANHELTEIHRTTEVLVKASERLRKAFVFLDDPVVYVLQKHVDPTILLHSFGHRHSFLGVHEVSALIRILFQSGWAMEKDVDDVHEVFVNQDCVF